MPTVTQSVGTLSSSLDVLTTSTVGAGGATAALAGPVGIAVAALAAEITVVTTLSVGLFELARSTATAQGNLYDLEQQTGVMVETLAGLEVLARTTGGNLQTISQSLVVFQGNMDEAGDANSKAGKTFKELNITVTDTEQTLRDTLNALARMPQGFEQTNRAAELFGRRGGKQMLAILKESKGDINSVIRELQGMGLANAEAARRSDEFNDQLVTLDVQLLGLKATIGNEIIPTITGGAKQIERIIKDNRDGIEALGVVARGFTVLIGGPLVGSVQALGYIWKAHQPVINAIREAYEATAAAIQLVTGRIPQVDPNAIPQQPTGAGAGDGIKLLQDLQKAFLAKQEFAKSLLKPFEQGLKEMFGEKKAKAEIDPAITILKQLQQEFRTLSGVTRAEEIAAQLLDERFKDVNSSLREQILLVAKTIDVRRLGMEADQEAARLASKAQQDRHAAQESLTQFKRQQAEALRELRFGPKTAIQEAEEFLALIPQAIFLGTQWAEVITDVDVAQIRLNARLLESADRTRRMLDLMRDTIDLVPAPGRALEFDDSSLGLPPPARDMERLRQMQEVAEDLGFIFGDVFDSIGRGWEGLWQSMARTAQDIARQIAQDLFRGLIQKLLTGSTGGTRVGGIAGLLSGSVLNRGASEIPGRALGGPVEAGHLYQVNETRQEFFRPSVSGTVIPLGQQPEQQAQSIARVAVFDDMRQLREWRPDWVVKKSNRKLGRLIPGFN